ncbi:MAG: alpha/beta hydrolase, partial [Mycobacteriales bacterium]
GCISGGLVAGSGVAGCVDQDVPAELVDRSSRRLRWGRRTPVFIAPTRYQDLAPTAFYTAGASHYIYANQAIRAAHRAVVDTFRNLVSPGYDPAGRPSLSSVSEISADVGEEWVRKIPLTVHPSLNGSDPVKVGRARVVEPAGSRKREDTKTGSNKMTHIPGSDPYHADGGRIGILIGHGFTGSPLSVRPWAEYLAAAGYTVSLPLLPGHGTRWEDLELTLWTDWYGALEKAYLDLSSRCDEVFGFGLSMGGGLILRLAEEHDLAGLVLLNPSVGSRKIGTRLLARVPAIARAVRTSHGIGGDIRKPGGPETSYDRVPVRAAYQLTRMWRTIRDDLHSVTAPTLVFRSRVDHIVDGRSIELLKAGLTNAVLEERVLENSYHVASLDNDAEEVFAAASIGFGRRVCSAKTNLVRRQG